VIIHAPSGRQFIRDGDDVFTGTGAHVARITGTVAHASSGRYVGTLEGDLLAFRSTDRESTGALYVRGSHPGFAHGGEAPQTLSGEDEPWIEI
jgi:hypothetical protein